MPDAFFATKKTRKRKRSASADHGPSTSKKPARPTANGKRSAVTQSKQPRIRDEELSDETSEGDAGGIDDLDLRAPDVDEYQSAEEDEDETPAEKRLRLAKLYLESVKKDLTLADGEYDAAEIDKEIISARLKQDVMEHSGKLHLFIADNYDFSNTPTWKTPRAHRYSVTSAVASEDAHWLYTSSKDGTIVKYDLTTGRKAHTFHKLRPIKTHDNSNNNKKDKGKGKADPNAELKGHSDEVWALALSPDGRLLASGGKDRRVCVWDVEKNEWVKSFGGHRDSVSALTFRKASKLSPSAPPSQLYTASFDRTIKLFDLSPQTMGYVETLFGHQAPILCVDALMKETAVSVGGRDKSVRFWKVPEESQLVFRGGGRSGWEDVLKGGVDDDGMEVDEEDEGDGRGGKRRKGKRKERFVEGSIECVAMIDENTFVSGGDSGSISLWATHKKKPIFTQPLAHGLDESQTHDPDSSIVTVRKPRWITALASLRYSDLFASGSWDGSIRLWKLDAKVKGFELAGEVKVRGVVNTLQFLAVERERMEGMAWTSGKSKSDHETDPSHSNSSENVGSNDDEPNILDGPAPPSNPSKTIPSLTNGHSSSKPSKSTSGITNKSLLLVAGVGQEMKFGRWVEKRGEGVVNGALVVAIHPRTDGKST